jgi:glutamyl-tRNA synthetase
MLLRDRVSTLVEMADAAHYFYERPSIVPQMFAERMTDAVRPAVAKLLEILGGVEWTRDAINKAIKAAAAACGLKPPQLMMALRALVTGQPQTPAIDAVLEVLGRERSRARIEEGLLL